MKLPNAYFVPRVTEALSSLAQHVLNASDIALDIHPVGVTKLPFEESQRLAAPHPKSLHPSVMEASASAKAVSFKVRGEDLDDLSSFALLPADDLSGAGHTGIDPESEDESCTVTVDLSAAEPGAYHLWVRNSAGLEAVLPEAFEITSRAAVKTPEWSMEPVDPDFGHPGTTVDVIIVSSGFPSDVNFEIGDPLSIEAPVVLRHSRRVAVLKIKIPDRADTKDYSIIASGGGARVPMSFKVVHRPTTPSPSAPPPAAPPTTPHRELR